MLRLPLLLVACLTFIFLCGETKADLVIVVDTSNETLLFTGSDSGISSDSFSVSWETGTLEGGSALTEILIGFDNGESGVLLFSSTGIALDVFVDSPNEPVILSSENGIPLSFSSLPDDQIAFFESQIGNSLGLSFGTEFDDIRIVAAVPEPTSAVLLYPAFALLAVRRKRR